MSLLDKLGVLAQTVVGVPGLEPGDRVKLAGTISECVTAVGEVQIPDEMLAAAAGGGEDDSSSSDGGSSAAEGADSK